MNKAQQPWLNELNNQQKQAVIHKDSPLLVVAGAGSGKTRTLAYRVAHLISQGVAPNRILLLTFTRRASKEMLNRAASAISTKASLINQVWGGTFHATANRLLRIYAKSANLSPDFTIIDQSDAADLIDVIRHKNSFSKLDKRFPKKNTCLAIYSRKMNSNEDIKTIIKEHFPWCEKWVKELKVLFKEYVQQKQKLSTLDYDDLLLYWYYLLDDEKVAESIEKRFDHILVDEYQDTNRIQAEILVRMRKSNKNILVVGDDAQSIYSFRSANVQNMLDFPKYFSNTKIIKLEQNYRSTEPILTTTNKVIAQAKNRYSKDLFTKRKGGQRPQLITCKDESHQDEIITKKILEHYEQGIPLHKQVVLFRASSHSNSLEITLAQKNIPFHKFGGLRFLETAHVKDMISILRIIENPKDEMAWFRILKLFDGVGPITASNLFKHVIENHSKPSSIETAQVPQSAHKHVQSFAKLFLDIEKIDKDKLSAQVERINKFYLPLVEKNYENPQPRINDIEHLVQLASNHKSRTQFLADLILDPPVSTSDFAGPPKKDEDYLILSTIHSAKGGEWDAVYLIHAADGCLPSDMATDNEETIEEELRLTYVAMTRAKDFLYVTWPLRFYSRKRSFSDIHVYAQCCRFFNKEVIETVDEMTLSDSKNRDDESFDVESSKDIGAKIQSIWD